MENRIKSLFIPSWYPNKENEVSGIFIRNQAISISKMCDVAVLYVKFDEQDLETVSKKDGILEIIFYRKKVNISLPTLLSSYMLI